MTPFKLHTINPGSPAAGPLGFWVHLVVRGPRHWPPLAGMVVKIVKNPGWSMSLPRSLPRNWRVMIDHLQQ